MHISDFVEVDLGVGTDQLLVSALFTTNLELSSTSSLNLLVSQ